MLRHALFDLDDTLYSAHTGLWGAIGERINRYMIERVGLDPAQVTALRDHYLNAFGTTLNGLRHDYDIEPQDYLDFVHDLPVENYLQPDPALNAMLARLPLAKSIFTNSDARHVRRVLDRLGVTRHFTHIIDIHTLDFVNKPEPAAYDRALAIVQARPPECMFIEDSVRNLLPARAVGMLTVLVGGVALASGVDYHIAHILDLERIVASLMGQV
jgi:putative hydrolase of the HAD superfamily